MADFAAGDQAIVTSDSSRLRAYGSVGATGKKVKVICRSYLEGYDGYEVEYTDDWGSVYTYFIASDDLIRAPSKYMPDKVPRWQSVAKQWQDRLWKDKLKEK